MFVETHGGLTPGDRSKTCPRKGVRPLLVLALLFLSGVFPVTAEEEHPVFLLEVSGTIDPALARYVTRGLELARQRQASAVVLRLDTPGGLDGSMRKIVQGILNSPVPVLVHVAPQGARAASAGVLIAQSAHVAVTASDLEDLLQQVDGRMVKTVFGVTTLSVRDQPKVAVPMSATEKLIHQLSHPNLAYILLLLGIYGLIYELATPGATFPGVVGALLLILALVALETLEVNWGGVALIALSLIFFIADIKLPGTGALTLGGIIAFAIGSLFLFPGVRIPPLRLPWSTIGLATTVTAAFFLGIVGMGLRALKRRVTSGVEGLIGAEGTAKTDLKPDGIVNVRGEEWQARSTADVRKGARVRVIRLEGLTVWVEPILKEGGSK